MTELAEWVEQVRAAERRGEQLLAFDLAERALEEHPDDLWLRHRAVLALARAGSTTEAARRFVEYGLGDVDDEDAQALWARIAKDQALAASGAARGAGALRAAALYSAVFEQTGGPYPGVNAATLFLLGGRRDEARAVARRVLAAVAENADDYYAAATEAEALLVLGDATRAEQALARAAGLHGGDWGAVAATRRQLRLVCAATGVSDDVLLGIAGRPVLHFCGHRIAAPGEGGRFSAADEHIVAGRIAAAIADDPPAAGYGALASGSDILCAEALLAAGAELHVVLPFAVDDFIASSVLDSGGDWVARFHRCMDAAASITLAAEEARFGDDDVLFRYGSELAMGLALLRARFLDATARQIAVWDGRPATGEAGTARDVETWRSGGRETVVVAPGTERPPAPDSGPEVGGHTGRVVRALMFADVYGFSRLSDVEIQLFVDHVLAAIAGTLARFEPAVEYRNTWGDALYAVFTTGEHAAACALELQEALAAIDLAASGLPDHLALRLGLHLGPVIPTVDPVTGASAFMGSHVSRTARIEPVTPPGAVYVTNHVAASLVLHGAPYACDYVGHIPAAKDYGRLRMYRLRRSATG